ncbi:MAG TPA: hypothetical protein VFB35_08700 [Gaiellaceae bacterium]|nr:hypothetical protein [Gaiellaceae bacterium]
MPAEITPEPTADEREVLLRALAGVDGDGTAAAAVDPWWLAGIREAVEAETDAEPA